MTRGLATCLTLATVVFITGRGSVAAPPDKPAAIPAEPMAAPATKPSTEKKARALADQWSARFAEEKFNHLVAGPFVLAGNSSRERLESYRDHTVVAAARALGAQFFTTPPDEPVLILLFE